MDFLTTHWQPFQRRFPSRFPVVSFQYLRGKSEWLRQPFRSCNFSLILRGSGEFHRRGTIWEVLAPCVITQWPGEYVEYGPAAPSETWDELYFIYSPELFSEFRKVGLVDLQRPVWGIANRTGVETKIEELRLLAASETPERVADRVDRVAEQVILETLLPAPDSAEHVGVLLERAADWKKHLAEVVDFAREASRCGMSTSTFRRAWQRVFSMPPGQYLLRIRMHEACRLLVESAMSIKMISHCCGFEDELYFSRRFRGAMGVPPREYRKLYRMQTGK